MKTTIEFILFLTLILFGFSCSKEHADSLPPETHQTKESKDEHNFELTQLGPMRRDQFLIDKKTGQLWVKKCLDKKPKSDPVDCDYIAWIKEDVEGIDGETIDSILDKADRLSR